MPSTSATVASYLASSSSSTSRLTRLNKIVQQHFKCSRREANVIIKDGFLTVNGQLETQPGARYNPQAIQLVLERTATERLSQQRTILLNKPPGYVSGQPERPDQIPAIRLLTQDRYQPNSSGRLTAPTSTAVPDRNGNKNDPRDWSGKLAVAGRLDCNSTGLLVFTQSGHIATRILGNTATTSPNEERLEKEYLVRVPPFIRLLPENAAIRRKLESLRHGIEHGGELLQAKSVEVLNDDQVKIVLTTGRKHQIRRMMRAVGWPVQVIKRVRIGRWALGNLKPGYWRFVGDNEPL